MSMKLARCFQDDGDTCFAFYQGYCQALQDTIFRKSPCTFHKTVAQIDAEQKKTVERLQSFGLKKVLEKYRYLERWD